MALLEYTREMRFVDRSRQVDIVGPGEFEVPEDAVDEYLAHGGWREVSGARQLSREKWSKIKREVSEGEHDDILDELEELEHERAPGVRESVITAINDRREEISDDSDTSEE